MDYGVEHVRHELDELQIEHAARCGEEAAIPPAIPDWAAIWRYSIENAPKFIEVCWRLDRKRHLDCFSGPYHASGSAPVVGPMPVGRCT